MKYIFCWLYENRNTESETHRRNTIAILRVYFQSASISRWMETFIFNCFFLLKCNPINRTHYRIFFFFNRICSQAASCTIYRKNKPEKIFYCVHWRMQYAKLTVFNKFNKKTENYITKCTVYANRKRRFRSNLFPLLTSDTIERVSCIVSTHVRFKSQ